MIVLLFVACGGPGANWLEGSLVDTYDIKFQETRARLYTSELAIEYVEEPETLQAVTFRITLDLDESPPMPKTRYDLSKYGWVSRSDAYEAPFPDLVDGQLEIFEYQDRPDSDVAGEFGASFETSEGNTLVIAGAFATALEVVDL